MISIGDIEGVFNDIFDIDEGNVVSIDTKYETPSSGDYIKLIISLHGLASEDISIIHTKFIFKVDLKKHKLVENSFIYLYDINCIYHKMKFDGLSDLKDVIKDIIVSNNFGVDLKILSDFIEAPAMFLNYYMRRDNITDYSIFEVQYQPKFKTSPCDKTTFDFKININNNYNMELSIKKYSSDSSSDGVYKFQFRFMDDIDTYETDSLKNIHYFIGSHIAKILDRKLKNK